MILHHGREEGGGTQGRGAADCFNGLLAGKHTACGGLTCHPAKCGRDGASDLRATRAGRLDRIGIVGRLRADQAEVDDGKSLMECCTQDDVVEHHESDASRGRLVVRKVAVVHGTDARRSRLRTNWFVAAPIRVHHLDPNRTADVVQNGDPTRSVPASVGVVSARSSWQMAIGFRQRFSTGQLRRHRWTREWLVIPCTKS